MVVTIRSISSSESGRAACAAHVDRGFGPVVSGEPPGGNRYGSSRLRTDLASGLPSCGHSGGRLGITPSGRSRRGRPSVRLSSEAELRDDRAVALDIFALEVFQQPSAAPDQHQEAAAAVMFLLMQLEMLGEVADALGQHGDLHLGGTRVARGAGVLLDDLGLGFFGQRHDRTPRLPAATAPRPATTLTPQPYRG